MKEALLYAIAAAGSLSILGYSIHMLIGGIVPTQTERAVIAGACIVGAGIIGYMVRDVIRRRKAR